MLFQKIAESKSWENLLNSRDKEELHRKLEKLPEDSRAIIYLRYWKNIEFKEIAEVLGLRLRQVEYIHEITLRLLSKALTATNQLTKCRTEGVTA